MSKKSLDRKVVKQFIVESRSNGKTDQEIYNELSQQYYDKKTVALLINGTATKADKDKYKLYNSILLVLLGVTVLLKVLIILNLSLQEGQLWALLLVFVVPLLNIYFIFEIARYSAPAYRFCGFLTIASFFQGIVNSKSMSSTDIIINLILVGGIVGLSFYLDRKLFPNYSPSSLKKDSNGEYKL